VSKSGILEIKANLDLRSMKETFLLPLGEGQDEGIKNESLGHSNPLTPTLSLRERE